MSIGLTRILQQITGLNTFFQGPNAGRMNGVVLEDSDTVTWSTDGFGNVQAAASASALPTGSGNKVIATPANGSSGVSALRALVSADLPVGSASQLGALQVDGTTITATAGVISAAPAGAMTLIQAQTISGTGTVTFSAIPQTFKHLKIVFGASAASGGSPVLVILRFNGDSGFNYSTGGILNTNGTVTGPDTGTASSLTVGVVGGQNSGGTSEVTIGSYTNSVQKSAVGVGVGWDGGNVLAYTGGGQWQNTAAITSVTLTNGSGNFTGTFSLYGLS